MSVREQRVHQVLEKFQTARFRFAMACKPGASVELTIRAGQDWCDAEEAMRALVEDAAALRLTDK